MKMKMKNYTIKKLNYYSVPKSLIPKSKNNFLQGFILQFVDVFQQLKEEIESIQEIVSFNFDNTLKLFIHYNWNVKKIENNYFSGDQDKIIEELKSAGEFNDHKISIIAKGHCPVCLEDEKLVQLGCGNSFCRNCLKQSLRQKVEKEEYHYVRCFQDRCPYSLPHSFIITCTESYNNILCKLLLNKAKVWLVAQVQIVRKQSNLSIIHKRKFSVNVEMSFVSDAEMMLIILFHATWCKNGLKQLEMVRQVKIAINTKQCPFCQMPFVRGNDQLYIIFEPPPEGCGKSFCFLCRNSWQPDHICMYRYPNQNTFSNVTMICNFKPQSTYYYDRYIDCENKKKLAQKRFNKLNIYSQMIFKNYGSLFKDYKFLSDALREQIQSSDELKWSYCLGYFINSNDKIASQIIDNYLEQFEHFNGLLKINLLKLFEESDLISQYKKKVILICLVGIK